MEEPKKMETYNSQGLYNSMPEGDSKSSFDFRNLYTMVILNWQWIILSLVICVGAAAVYLRYATPVYQAYVKMLIKDDTENSPSGMRSGRSSLTASSTLGIISNSAGIDNEMEILSSTKIAQRTVTDLKLYVDYSVSGRVRSHTLYQNQPIDVDLDANSLEKLKMPIKLSITRENGKLHIKGTYTYLPNDRDLDPVPYTIDKTVDRLPYNISTSVGTISFKENPVSKLDEGKTLKAVIVSPAVAARKYVSSLSISPTSKTTTIAQLVMRDQIPQRAIDYLKQLIVCYNRQANEDKNEIAMRTEQFINSRLEKINSELGATEGDLESTKRRYGIIDPQANSVQALTNSNTYTQKLAEMNMQIELLRSINDYMNEPTNKYQTLPSNVGLTDPTSSMLINKYNEIVMERNRLLRSASETSPSVAPLTAQLNELVTSIRRAMSQAQRSAEIQRNNVQAQYNLYSKEISSTPEQERILTQIGRQQEVKSGLYLMLLQKREENSISLAATADKGKLIDEPQFMGKISPKSHMIMLIAFVLGLGIPLAVFFLINYFRYRIEGHDDVETLTELPIIGDVAIANDAIKTKGDIVVHENKNNIMEEVFRSMRANVQFMLEEGNKVIMFTSTTSGEGKTFTAANLAVSFALLGRKVVLVGLDIRKPRLTKLFEIKDKQRGITNLLMMDSPSKSDVREQIVPSGVNANLDLLMAGPIPPNPTELVSRTALEDVFAALKEDYDYILVDTAPVGLVTDTIQIARIADATVYMCRADFTPRASFDFINKLDKQKKLPKMSVVINGIDISKKKYGYYYGYGKYSKYSRYGSSSRGSRYGDYSAFGTYGNYSKSGYGSKNDNSIKQ